MSMLEELLVLTTVVEQSSLNKASALLNLSQPALSRKVARLEEELGVELFRRVGKRLELTRVGQLTYEHAVELRQLHLRFLQTIAAQKDARRTSILIGASLTTLQSTLPDLIQMMTAADPELDIKAITGKTHEIVSLVRDKKADIGIVASRIDDPQLGCVPLFDDHLELVVPRGQLVAGKGGLELADLDRMPMILFSKGTWYRLLTDELFQHHELHPDVKLEIDSFEAILRLLHTMRAGTLLPQSYLREQLLRDNDLTVVPIRGLEQTKRTTSLIHGGASGLSPKIRVLIDQIAAHYALKRG